MYKTNMQHNTTYANLLYNMLKHPISCTFVIVKQENYNQSLNYTLLTCFNTGIVIAELTLKVPLVSNQQFVIFVYIFGNVESRCTRFR